MFKTTLRLTFLIAFTFISIVTLRHANAQSSEYTTIYAHKVVCLNESDLPNWGDGGEGTPDDIIESTAQDFVEASEGNCWLEPDWSFQWGFDSNEDEGMEGVHKLHGGHLGEADGTPSSCAFQCGTNTNTGDAYADWKNFDTATGAHGEPARIRVYDTQNAPGIWVREILKENYISYTYPPQGSIENDVTAELYCHNDIRNFDNYDLVWNPRAGRTYYCVGFNVPIGNQPDLKVTKDNGVLSVTPGSETTYTIIVTNIGDRIATGINVEDRIPEDTEFVGASDNGIYQNGLVTWELLQLTPNQSVTFTVTIKIDEQIEADQITNYVDVRDDGRNGEDKDTSNNSDNDTDELEYVSGSILTLSKSNNKIGHVLTYKDEVTYTLKLEALNNLENVTLIDLPPEGFEYSSGSWTANSNFNGNIKGSTVTEPTYASPGKWIIGNMSAGETIVLTYKAKISAEVDPGIYRDLAWAQGNFGQNKVLANENSAVNEVFVGTEVEVDRPNKSPKAEVSVDVEIEEVLASTSQRLPATGASPIWGILIMTLFLAGIVFVMVSLLGSLKKTQLLAIVTALLMGVIILGNQAYAEEKTTAVKIEEPKENTNGDFLIGFVALDLENKHLTAECLVMKPNEITFVKFGDTITLGNGGNSANCKADNALLTEEGQYTFKVRVFAEGTETDSTTVNVNYDNDGPNKPQWIKKREKDECKYEVTFKTADDNGETTYVEIYRENDSEFDANEDTRIKTINIGSDEERMFIDELDSDECGDTPYYAVRAFDSAGNASNVRPENNVTVTETKTLETAPDAIGAILINSDETPSTTNNMDISDFGLELDSDDNLGDVLGDEAFDTENLISEKAKTPNKILWLGGATLVLGLIYYFIKKRR